MTQIDMLRRHALETFIGLNNKSYRQLINVSFSGILNLCESEPELSICGFRTTHGPKAFKKRQLAFTEPVEQCLGKYS